VVVLPPAGRLTDLVAVLARAAAVVTPDTANVHLAAALGRPLVALFTPLGGTRMAHWAPTLVPHRFVVAAAREPLAALPAAAVLDAFDALWAEVAPLAPFDGLAPDAPAAGAAAAAPSAVAS
jgi:ADP-heptose:LPS heptosyltransferase